MGLREDNKNIKDTLSVILGVAKNADGRAEEVDAMTQRLLEIIPVTINYLEIKNTGAAIKNLRDAAVILEKMRTKLE